MQPRRSSRLQAAQQGEPAKSQSPRAPPAASPKRKADLPPLLTTYYTTKEQEDELDGEYRAALKAKQQQLDESEKRTGRINKFRAGMYITELDRVFEVAGGRATLRGRPCPTSAVRGGCIYLLEPALLGAAEDFHRRHGGEYTVAMKPRNSGGVYYTSAAQFSLARGEIHPALMRAAGGEELELEYQDDWDLVCG